MAHRPRRGGHPTRPAPAAGTALVLLLVPLGLAPGHRGAPAPAVRTARAHPTPGRLARPPAHPAPRWAAPPTPTTRRTGRPAGLPKLHLASAPLPAPAPLPLPAPAPLPLPAALLATLTASLEPDAPGAPGPPSGLGDGADPLDPLGLLTPTPAPGPPELG